MDNQDLPTEDHVLSTDLDTGAEPEFDNPDGALLFDDDTGFGQFDEPAEEHSPEEAVEEEVEDLEVSEDEAPSDDDTPDIESEEDADDAEEEEEDTPDSIVDFEEMKEHQFEIDGKVYSANDLKAALGRQTKQQEALKEVETRNAEVTAREERLNELLSASRQSAQLGEMNAQYKNAEGQYEKMKQARLEAAQKGDKGTYDQLSMQMDALKTGLDQAKEHINQATEQYDVENTKVQMKILEERGMSELVSDTQRNEAIANYANSIHPSLGQIAYGNAYVLELLDKAMRLDKAEEAGKSRKLKGSSKKTLKGGAGGPKAKAKPPTDSWASQMSALWDK